MISASVARASSIAGAASTDEVVRLGGARDAREERHEPAHEQREDRALVHALAEADVHPVDALDHGGVEATVMIARVKLGVKSTFDRSRIKIRLQGTLGAESAANEVPQRPS